MTNRNDILTCPNCKTVFNSPVGEITLPLPDHASFQLEEEIRCPNCGIEIKVGCEGNFIMTIGVESYLIKDRRTKDIWDWSGWTPAYMSDILLRHDEFGVLEKATRSKNKWKRNPNNLYIEPLTWNDSCSDLWDAFKWYYSPDNPLNDVNDIETTQRHVYASSYPWFPLFADWFTPIERMRFQFPSLVFEDIAELKPAHSLHHGNAFASTYDDVLQELIIDKDIETGELFIYSTYPYCSCDACRIYREYMRENF